MTIAFISDIHANLPALNAAFEDIDPNRVRHGANCDRYRSELASE